MLSVGLSELDNMLIVEIAADMMEETETEDFGIIDFFIDDDLLDQFESEGDC